MNSKKLLLVSVGSVLVVVGLTALLVLRHPAKVMRHPLTGYVLEVKPDMPGVMGAMVMDFPVKDAAVLKLLKPGDVIQATMVMNDAYAPILSRSNSPG